MALSRSSGVLLHPTSLPGPYGIGELGEHAYRFVDWLADAGQKYWQVMPLGQTGYGDSPYQSFSAFAGNPYLISLDTLVRDGLLNEADLTELPEFSDDRVDFGLQYVFRRAILARAFENFEKGEGAALRAELEAFRSAEEGWLTDYALYTAIKANHDGAAWNTWEKDIRTREPEALARWAELMARDMDRVVFEQFLFFRQWRALRQYAHGKGIHVIGDIPIFVALDSADAWANPAEFYFDEEGQPTVVAGVPPDYFSETGQLWGNPLYRWDRMGADGFRWWIRRFEGSLALYDVIRIDHFRGFDEYWEIPAGESTAVNGRWVKAPGHELFAAVKEALGDLPIIAEDLGLMTPGVHKLRDDVGFPGMAVLQFAFGSGEWNMNSFLPPNLKENQVVYTGTHDNDTTRGWWEKASDVEKRHAMEFIPDASDQNFAWRLTELAWSTRTVLAVVPMQDLLNLGSDARMNLPGTLGPHNWTWRARPEAFSAELARDLRAMTERNGR
ncbi:4-alpha-glucanotransferase [Deinococcus pimensis]|uniref:4-alpha-glucanotransferase n=1 Tax=Deinococcus pimensis TaxID=309888 RepID=UPI000483AA34|nr:4-alpha-glucanotransferase [Deinococcus pimensis]